MTRGICLTVLLVVLALTGCGSTSDDPETSGSTSAPTSSSHPSPSRPTAEQLRAWRAAGQHACHGFTAYEAAQHFKAAARRAGAHKRFIELITDPPPEVEGSAAYPKTVAAFYATTLPPTQRAAAAAGCAEELAAHP